MRLNPPKVVIDPEKPFEQALFERKDFALSLTGLLRAVVDNLVIFVNAPWGEGKTTFARMWMAHLKQQKLEVIYFDAYVADYLEDPFIAFSGEILTLAKTRLGKEKSTIVRRNFKKEAVQIGKKLAGLAVKVGLKAATMGAVEAAHIEELKEIGSEAASGVSEIGADLIEKKLESHDEEKAALAEFKESLAQLANAIREEQDFPLTIVVDELDRCRPDFALSLLEKIKHLFDVENVAFVLLVNRDQIETYIRAVYGDGVEAQNYLLKFANLFVDLPNREPIYGSIKGRRDYCVQLIQHHELSQVKDGDFFARCLEVLTNHFQLTLREIERVFTFLALYYASLNDRELTSPFLIVLLALLKVKNPVLFHGLALGRVSLQSFYDQTGLDKLPSDTQLFDTEWMKDNLAFCLMSETEFQEATKNDVPNGYGYTAKGPRRFVGWVVEYRFGRNQVIPFFCGRLGRFSLR